jgi:acetyl-CoA carboxylase biotin carboxyl carrier protein
MTGKKDEILYQVENLIHIMRENSTKKVNIETKEWKISIEQKEGLLDENTTMLTTNSMPQHSEPDNNPSDQSHTISTPLVGTFYRSSSPQSDPYIEIGDEVEEGQVLCIVEAMKVMNEIHSDVAGTINAILVDNGDIVEYGQSLFEIKTKEPDDGA